MSYHRGLCLRQVWQARYLLVESINSEWTMVEKMKLIDFFQRKSQRSAAALSLHAARREDFTVLHVSRPIPLSLRGAYFPAAE